MCPLHHRHEAREGNEGPPSYWEYLKLEDLPSLQGGLGEGEPVSAEELHLIVVHQTYELWLKLLLREVRLARDGLDCEIVPGEAIPGSVHHLGRKVEVLKLAELQWRVMETLPPQEFLAFRDKLVLASGFPSFQVRELEILLGLPDSARTTC